MKKTQEAIIDKVKKLLRLADIKSGGTPAEIAAAAAKAQQLLFEHNLAVEDVGDIHDDKSEEKITKNLFDLEATYLTSTWHAYLLHVISKPLFCRMIYHPAKAGKPGRTTLVGKPSNIAVCRYFYEYLHRTIDLMAVEYREEWKAKKNKAGEKFIPDDSFRVRMEFCRGAVSTIGKRMAEKFAEETTTSKDSRALVVISDQALDTAFKACFPKTQKTKSSAKSDASSFAQGMIAGGKIPLNRGVGGAGANKQVT